MAMIKTATKTTRVPERVSFLEGQVTFFSSVLTSLKNWIAASNFSFIENSILFHPRSNVAAMNHVRFRPAMNLAWCMACHDAVCGELKVKCWMINSTFSPPSALYLPPSSYGRPGGIWTPITRIWSPVLYPLELLAYIWWVDSRMWILDQNIFYFSTFHFLPTTFYAYFVSLWTVCLRQNRQYFLNSSLSGVVRLFFVVE